MYPEKPAAATDSASSLTLALNASSLPLPTRIAFIGNYLPRECGIATFTTDLCTALAAEYGEERLFAIPVNDPDSSYEYPEQVRLELEQEDLARMSARRTFSTSTATTWYVCSMNTASTAELRAAHSRPCCARLKMPLVTTLHTVLREPDPDQRSVLEEIARLSDRTGGDERAGRANAARGVCGSGRKDRRDSAWRAGNAVHGPELLQGQVRHRRQIRSADLRPAFAQQGHRECDSRAACDSGSGIRTWCISSPA